MLAGLLRWLRKRVPTTRAYLLSWPMLAVAIVLNGGPVYWSLLAGWVALIVVDWGTPR